MASILNWSCPSSVSPTRVSRSGRRPASERDAAWVLHDLRRSARSLMARAGVADHIAERTLGHTIRGVEGVYNRHDDAEEKADVLNKLARLIDTILNPREDNVVQLRR